MQKIDRHGTNLDPDALASIQQIYNNLASAVDVSEGFPRTVGVRIEHRRPRRVPQIVMEEPQHAVGDAVVVAVVDLPLELRRRGDVLPIDPDLPASIAQENVKLTDERAILKGI